MGLGRDPRPQFEWVGLALRALPVKNLVLLYSRRSRKTKLDLPWGAERVNTRSNSHAINVVACRNGSVDLSRCSCQESAECGAWQIEVCEIENIVETDTWLYC